MNFFCALTMEKGLGVRGGVQLIQVHLLKLPTLGLSFITFLDTHRTT
jgi:hypothetical protein